MCRPETSLLDHSPSQPAGTETSHASHHTHTHIVSSSLLLFIPFAHPFHASYTRHTHLQTPKNGRPYTPQSIRCQYLLCTYLASHLTTNQPVSPPQCLSRHSHTHKPNYPFFPSQPGTEREATQNSFLLSSPPSVSSIPSLRFQNEQRNPCLICVHHMCPILVSSRYRFPPLLSR